MWCAIQLTNEFTCLAYSPLQYCITASSNILLIPVLHFLIRVHRHHTLPAVPRRVRIIISSTRHLTRELLKRLPLRLRDQQRREDTAEHEQREDLHDVIEPGRRVLLGDRALCSQG